MNTKEKVVNLIILMMYIAIGISFFESWKLALALAFITRYCLFYLVHGYNERIWPGGYVRGIEGALQELKKSLPLLIAITVILATCWWFGFHTFVCWALGIGYGLYMMLSIAFNS